MARPDDWIDRTVVIGTDMYGGDTEGTLEEVSDRGVVVRHGIVEVESEEVEFEANPGATEPSSLSYRAGHLDLSGDEPQVFSPPLEGEGWIAINGCCGLGHPHRESVQSINGELGNSQRFAVDFMRLDDDGRLVDGDPANVSDWVDYGAAGWGRQPH